MELAVAALGSLLPKLATLLKDEYKLQKGIRGEIRFLKAEMECMQAALESVSKLPPQQIDALHSIWVRDLKELSYDIEDSVDSFMLRVDAPGSAKPKSFRRFFDRTIGLLTKAKARHHIADDIQDIKSRIQEVAGRRKRYKIPKVAVQPESTEIDPRLLAVFEDAAKLVGIEGPTQKVINLLNMGEGVQKEKLRVVSIVGVGGLGKTTVANSLYERLGGEFQCQAFVSVSLRPNLKQILSKILRQISKDECTNAGEKDLDELVKSIRKFLVDKRYLIVIDDVWDNKAWEIIKCALIDKTVGSRVIVTTRNIDVANFCSLDGEVFELEPLSDEDSKMLLSKRVFKEEDGIYSELEEVSNKILMKCGGMPLAIITISSLLASIPNKTKSEWYGVLKAMGSGLHKDRSLESMRGILHLSYSDLPSYLKPCLLYLSMFPEDYEIPSDDLVRLWIAEGFIDEKQGSNLYDLGERYFNELANRSMIQPIYYQDGSPSGCRVHDMILDLIISLSVQENFVTILEGPCDISSDSKIRRLSLRGSKSNSKKEQMIFPKIVNLSHVRSIIAFGDAVQWMPPMSMFPVLRVLALKTESRNNIHPKDLGSLQHLRYLELGGYIETELLEGIGNLKLLKTLDLWGKFEGELPASISQLQQLENLLTGDNEVKFPDGTGNLISLHELSWLYVSESPNTLAELGNLTKLRVLKIANLNENSQETFLWALSKLVNLRILDFYGDGTCNQISLDYMRDKWTGPTHLQSFGGNLTFSQVPRWFSFLSELSSLSMYVNLLRQEDLKLLGALPVLRFLHLQVDPGGNITEEELVFGADHPFRSLAQFEFVHYTGCWLEFAQGVMPKLQRLKLKLLVQRLQSFKGLENLASLKNVTVEVDCDNAWLKEVEDVEDKVRAAVEMHQNHPTLELSRWMEEYMMKEYYIRNYGHKDSEEKDLEYTIEEEDEDGHEESEESDECNDEEDEDSYVDSEESDEDSE